MGARNCNILTLKKMRMFRLDRLIDLAQNPSQEKLNLQNIIGCCDSWNSNW